MMQKQFFAPISLGKNESIKKRWHRLTGTIIQLIHLLFTEDSSERKNLFLWKGNGEKNLRYDKIHIKRKENVEETSVGDLGTPAVMD